MRKFILFSAAIYFALNLFSQPASWSPRGIGGGGALFSPSINPGNNSEYYIACDMSELFHTTDFGLTYSQVNFQEFVGGQNSKVCFTSTANLLYSIDYINEIGTPVKSTDNGVTWNTLSGNPDPGSDVYTIHVDYNNSNRVIISFYGSLYCSTNGGTNFTQFHTATDGGAGNVVGGVLFEGSNIYVGTNDGVIVSTNAGANWTTATITGLPTAERIWSFAAAKVGATTRFFCLTGNAADIYVGLQGYDYSGFFKGVYSCDYGSTNWVSKINGITASDYPMYIDMAENDINTVYVAGSNTGSEPIIMKTTNAGSNWANTFITASNQNIITGWSGSGGDRGWSYGECPFGFDVAASNAQTVIFGDFGFCHKTTNGGTTWQQAYVNTGNQHPANSTTPPNQSYNSIGLENTTCWQVLWIDANNMWACYSDIRGIRSTDAGNSWSFNYTGNTANSAYRMVKGGNGTLYAGTSNIHDMYQSTRLQDAILDAADANGKIIYSTNGGQAWQQLHLFSHPVYWIALDPNNANRAYASVIHYNSGSGIGGVYRCNDLQNLATSTWTLLPNPPRTEKHPACLVVLNDGKLVATYSGRRNAGGTFTASSGVFVYDPTGNSWTDVSAAGMNYWTNDIVVDPNDVSQNTWYVCVFSGWGGAPNGLGGLYKTTDRGTGWTKLTGSTIDRVKSCTFNPNNANEIYLTTEGQGLWMSSNINAVTPAFSIVSNYPFRQPERVFFNPYNTSEMWVSSFGNGMKTGLLSTGTIEFRNNESSFNIYPNPANSVINISLSLNQNSQQNPINITITDILGKTVYSKNYNSTKNQFNTSININSLKKGIYFVRVNDEARKLIVQ
ncbi:MAG: T9SS type A sorting domain-containing protein [Bacteroidales bacterium]|nr:T9SS type A sorting domain-containing protein [Bacteroidales bacterium]